VGPGVGAVVGQDLGHAIATHGGAGVGVAARAEMSGLLLGSLTGVLYAILAIRSTVAFGGRLRGRVADPALLPAGALAALALLAGQRHVPGEVVAAIRWMLAAAWLLGLLLLLVSTRHRPPEPLPVEPAPPEPVITPAAPAPESEWERYVSEADDDG
jgi:hypothetical protein